MTGVQQFRLPDVGEGLTEAEIVRWHVQPGDQVTVNQIIVEIETAKAVVELPCPWVGAVDALLVPEGATVDVGTPIITYDPPRGSSLFGPVISTVPDDDETTLALYDALRTFADYPGFSELKRGNRPAIDLPLFPRRS